FFRAEDGIRDFHVTGVQTCALPISIVAYDFGIKENILRHLSSYGVNVTVVPADTTAKEALALKPDGIFLSNGPGDPAGLTYAVKIGRASCRERECSSEGAECEQKIV